MEYGTEILSLLQSLEYQRVAALEKFVVIILFVFLINLLFFFKFRSNFLPILALSFFLLIGSFYMLNTKYKTVVERDLLSKLVKVIDPDFDYFRDEHIKLKDINTLKYFSHKIDNLKSDGTIKIKQNGRSAGLSFITLESIKVDTEEGEHESVRFDGAVVVLDFTSSFDQNYLLNVERFKTPEFEAGDYLNLQNMGLKSVKVIDNNFMLYCETGNSLLDEKLIQKVLEFSNDLKTDSWAIFSGNRGYIFVEGINSGFGISLLRSLKEQNFVANYTQLLQRVKGVVIE